MSKRGIFIGAIIFAVVLLLIGGFFQVSRKTADQIAIPIRGGDADAPETAKISLPIVDKFPDDTDRDGILNEKEKELGLDAGEFDTDGDGLSDQSELSVWKTDPKKADTDVDGFLDGAEVVDGYNPNGPGKR